MSRTIFISNVGAEVTTTQLRQLCEKIGKVARVTIPAEPGTGRARGFAFVDFETRAAAGTALEQLDGVELAGERLGVRQARPKKQSSQAQRRPEDDARPERGATRPDSDSWFRDDGGYGGGAKGRGGWREERHRQGHRKGTSGSRPSRHR